MVSIVDNSMFELSYNKRKNTKLFSSLEEHNITKLQNFIPIYNNFFELNETNSQNINLNHKYHIADISQKISDNKYVCQIKNDKDVSLKRECFFKFSPLLDPIKFMIGKYDISSNLLKLPAFNDTSCHKKIRCSNNSAYVDGFFSYLTSKLLNSQRFIHGTEFYGSFIAIKEQFHYNVFDDFDYLNDSDFFHKNVDKLFWINNETANFFYGNSRHCKLKLEITDKIETLSCEDINDKKFDEIFTTTEDINKIPAKELIFEYDLSKNKTEGSKTNHSNSTCSSRSSHTESLISDSDSEKSSDQSDATSNNSDEMLDAVIKDFPVNIICLESLNNTLDNLLYGHKILSIPEWKSILFQVLFILATYQKVFSFTHNDLHTNNIMYKEVDKNQCIYYYINDKYYKIPTFGKVFKIIDFGRAIYKFRSKTICSDSFQHKGDAATQYNFEPFLNKNKPRLEPNFSFDLARLACSLYDYFVPYSDEERKVTHPIGKIIIKWCSDDNGKNILYKKNGDERYPDFKLYKMIARTVHNHIPLNELKNEIFNEYITTKKRLKGKRIINYDKLCKCF
jgi:hypothetical protein